MAYPQLMTIENMTQFPLSQFLRSVILDVKNATAAGITIDMKSWVVNYKKKVCSVCLGGACLLGFGIKSSPYYTQKVTGKLADAVLALDFLRKDSTIGAQALFKSAGFRVPDDYNYLSLSGPYYRRLNESQIKQLIEDINALADKLELDGY